jgi:hypothetical protein
MVALHKQTDITKVALAAVAAAVRVEKYIGKLDPALLHHFIAVALAAYLAEVVGMALLMMVLPEQMEVIKYFNGGALWII